MNKLSIKSLIEFRRKSDNRKKTFIRKLLSPAITNSEKEGGGDYWISCLSAISNSYKQSDLQIMKNKIDEIAEKIESEESERTKNMYKRNIDILHNCEDIDFKKLKPSGKLLFHTKQNTSSILSVKGLQIQAIPHHVFSFKKNEIDEIGAIWFIAKLGGYREDELGMFAGILHEYLTVNYSEKFTVNPKYCVAVDVVNQRNVNYAQIQKGNIPKILEDTVDEILLLL